MSKTKLISYYCLLVIFFAKTYSKEINKITAGISSITNALGSAALQLKKTYDQIVPNAVNTNKAIATNNAQVKDQDAKIDAILAGVKQWMINDSNTKQQALQVLQRNVEVINKEVDKAKKQLEIANAAADKVSAKDKAKFVDAIRGAANAVSANTQYYMATKTRFDYETKYKELIDTRSRRLDMVKRINDPSVIRELLSDNNDLSNKKYADQLGNYVEQDAKLHEKLSQAQSNQQFQPVQQSQTTQLVPIQQTQFGQLQSVQQPVQQVNTVQQMPQYAQSQMLWNNVPQINPQQLKQQQPQQLNTTDNDAIWHNVNSISTNSFQMPGVTGIQVDSQLPRQILQLNQTQLLKNNNHDARTHGTTMQTAPTQTKSNIQQKTAIQQQSVIFQPGIVTQQRASTQQGIPKQQGTIPQQNTVPQQSAAQQKGSKSQQGAIAIQQSVSSQSAQPEKMGQKTMTVNLGNRSVQINNKTNHTPSVNYQINAALPSKNTSSGQLIDDHTNNKILKNTAKITPPPKLVKKSSNKKTITSQPTNTSSKMKKKLPMPGLLASIPSDRK